MYYNVLEYNLLHCTTQYCIVLHCTTLYYTVLHCTTLYDTVLHCTTLYYTVLHCTTLYYTVLHCTTLYYNVLLCTCEFWLFVGETLEVGSCLSISISRKEKHMENFWIFCYVGKFWGTQPLTKEFILSLRRLLLKKNTSQKTRKLPWSLPMFVIQRYNLHRNSNMNFEHSPYLPYRPGFKNHRGLRTRHYIYHN
jgi:hypothetical protein